MRGGYKLYCSDNCNRLLCIVTVVMFSNHTLPSPPPHQLLVWQVIRVFSHHPDPRLTVRPKQEIDLDMCGRGCGRGESSHQL